MSKGEGALDFDGSHFGHDGGPEHAALGGDGHGPRGGVSSAITIPHASQAAGAEGGAGGDGAAGDAAAGEGGAGADNDSDAEGGSGSKHMVGAYSPRARRARIERFLEKRKQRVWTKKTQYSVRKNFANSRMRVKGRFITKDDEAMLKELMALS